MTTQRRKGYGTRLAPGISELIEGFALRAYSGSQVHRVLQGLEARGELPPNSVPDIRTVQRILRELPAAATTEVEQEEAIPSEDLRLTLDAVAELVAQGMPYWAASALRDRMARLIRLAPGLSSRGLWRLAIAYRSREASNRSTDDLDAWVAFRPWRSWEDYAVYIEASEDERLPRLPWFDPITYPDDWETLGIFDPLLEVFVTQQVFKFGGRADEQEG